MKHVQKFFYTAMLMTLAVFMTGALARAEHTRVTNPNVVSLEILGRGLFYSVQFDRAVSDDIVAGIGLGTSNTKDGAGLDVGHSVSLFPAYVNYYFARDASSLLVTGGVTLVTNASEVQGLISTVGGIQFSSSAMMPTAGVGYEDRSDNGFIVRLNAYALFAKTVKPWFGFAMGAAF